ncbi:MAG: hypothetical protein WCC94_10705 [Candidatus Bathyarchaeia archaeon]|jgi:hypothetical protein
MQLYALKAFEDAGYLRSSEEKKVLSEHYFDILGYMSIIFLTTWRGRSL